MRKEDCGKKSLLFRDTVTGEYFGTMVSCKDVTCPICSERASEYLKERIAYYADVLKLNQFVTFTTGQKDAKELSTMFSNLMKELRKLEKQHFANWYRKSHASRKKATDQEVQNEYDIHIDMVYRGHYFLTWLYGLDKNNRGKYVPSVHIGLQVHELISKPTTEIKKYIAGMIQEKNKGVKPPMKKTVDSYFESYVKPYVKKWKEVSKYKDIQAAGRVREYAEDFKTIITDIALNWFNREVFKQEYLDELKKKIPPEGLTLSFIRVFELHKKAAAAGIPHIHALLNYFVPHSIVKEVFGNFVYDLQDLTEGAEKVGVDARDLDDLDPNRHHDIPQTAAEYVGKYIEKTLLELIVDEAMEKVDVISTSHDIKLRIEDAFKRIAEAETNWEFIKVSDGVLKDGKSSSFASISEFDSNLIAATKTDHPNEYIQAMRQAYLEYNERTQQRGIKKYEKEKLRLEINEKYADLHAKALAVELERRSSIVYPAIVSKRKTPSRGMLSDEQYNAVSGLLSGSYGMGFLIGYAGSGKTFTLSHLVNEIDLEKNKVAIVSFTARAVARTKEMMQKNGIDFYKLSVETIHKLCSSGFTKKIDYPIFYNDWEKPIPYDVIIIDEYSMVGLELLVNFLAAVNPKTKIIYVGDEAQLNPVKSKNPKHYLISEGELFSEYPVYELTKNYRSGEAIADRANEVRKGDLSNIEFVPFSWKTIEQEKKDGARILTNSNALNADVNHHFQDGKTDIQLRYKYNIFDEIMLTRNDQYKRYVNGEFGQIIAKTDEIITIQLEKGNIVELTYPRFRSSVVPNHAMTVHKSQGSEFENVLIILDTSLSNLTNRNILYTGITRAQRKFTVMIVQEMTDEIRKKLSELQA